MQQRIHASDPYFTKAVRTTCWVRTRPGSRPTLERAMRRVLLFSQRQGSIGIIGPAQHLITQEVLKKPWGLEDFFACFSRIELSAHAGEIDLSKKTIFEIFLISNTSVSEVILPDGICFLGHWTTPWPFSHDDDDARSQHEKRLAVEWEEAISAATGLNNQRPS
ncbi:MAG: hypothetical protein AAF909_12345 [Pseudomonadota bacterium]